MTVNITDNIRVADNKYGGFNIEKLVGQKEGVDIWKSIANYQTLDVLLSRIALKCPEIQDENLTDVKQICSLLKEISDRAFCSFRDIAFEGGQFTKLKRNEIATVEGKKVNKVLTEEHKRRMQIGRQNSKLKRDNAIRNASTK